MKKTVCINAWIVVKSLEFGLFLGEMITMVKLVTIDLDYPTDFELLKTYYNMRHFFGNVRFRKSSRKGYHFVSEVDSITHEEVLTLRTALGDDLNRIMMDTIRSGKMVDRDVLWDCKGYDDAGDFVESEELLCSEVGIDEV